MSFEGKDYYEILGVARESSADEIRRAYRQKARQLHPDVNKATDAAEQFAKIQEAYDVLSDDEKRTAYDNFLRYGVRAGGPREAGGGSTWQGGGVRIDPSDFASIFNEIFGARARAGRRSPGGPGGGFGVDFDAGPAARPAAARRGDDVRQSILVSFMDAALGATRSLRITVDGRSETIDVRIPQGVHDGAKLRIKGKGQPGRGGRHGDERGQRGDLILAVTVGEHPYFRREGLDVLLDVPITIAEAALGATVRAPLLKGSVDLKVPPGTASGQRLRLRGMGIDAGGKKGDFHAVIQIVAPVSEDLLPEDRDALAAMGGRLKNPRSSAPWSDIG